MRLRAVLYLLIALSSTAAHSSSPFGELAQEAQSAYQQKDYTRLRSNVQAMLRLRPGHPRLLYNLAAAEALLDQRSEAIAVLERLQRMGLSFQPGTDADFAGLKSDAGFQRVVTALQRNGLPQGSAKIAFSAGSTSFIPEGIAYDPVAQLFYLGSVHERRILKVDTKQKEQEFVVPGRDGLWSVQGLQVDMDAQLLWAASSALPEMQDYDPLVAGRSGLFAFDLADGKLRHKFMLPADGRAHALGDVIVDADGRLYASDSSAGQLYTLDRKEGGWTPLAPSGLLVSPQGMTLSSDDTQLFVADYSQGLLRLDLKTRQWTHVAVPDEFCVYGIDGLYRHREELIAVQNGVVPARILRLRLNKNGDAVQQLDVLAAALPEFEEPTLGTVVGDRFFVIANSQWNRFDNQHRLPPAAELAKPRVLRIELEPR